MPISCPPGSPAAASRRKVRPRRCSPNPCRGACCYGTPTQHTCILVSEAVCLASPYFGSYKGDGTGCAPDPCLEACCLPDGTCQDLVRTDCLAQPGALYLVYLPNGGAATLDITKTGGEFSLSWFNPREGGEFKPAGKIRGGASATLNAPGADDWLAVVRR